MQSDSPETEELIRCGRLGDRRALDELFSRHRDKLRRMVRLRIDRRLQGRLDTADVLQEVFLEAARRLPQFLREPKLPFLLWLRSIAGQKLIDLHRHHLGAQVRDPRREVRLHRSPMPEVTSAVLAAQLLGNFTTPSRAAMRDERTSAIQELLNSMDPQDREVIALRHFERLSNAETAQELGIQESAASKRYIRALKKLKGKIAQLGGGSQGWF